MERARFRRRYGLSTKLRHVPMAPAAACHAASADVSDTPPVAPALPAEAPELARLLSSFFRTSCLVLWDETGARLHHSARLLVCLAAPPPTPPPPHTHTHRACSVCAWLSRSGVSHLSSPSVEQEGRWRWEGEGSTGVHLGFGCWLAPQASSMVYLVLLGAGIRSMSSALQSWESSRQEQIPPVSSCGWVDINMTMKRTIMHSKEKGNKQPNKQARLASLGKQTNRQRLKVQEQDFLTNQGGASACRVSSSLHIQPACSGWLEDAF